MLFFGIIVLYILVSLVYWTLKNGISPMPTTPAVTKDLLVLLPNLPDCQIAELGCGWGSLLIPLANRYPHCHIIGYETSPIPFLFSWIRSKMHPQSNISVLRKDFFKEPLNQFHLVVCYLYPGAMQKLSKKLSHELAINSYVVSNTFSLPGWTPEKTVIRQDLYRTHLYLYKKGIS